jgi:hypothetical protein
MKEQRWERMDAEFRFRLKTQIEGYISAGLSGEKAELRARCEFGPVELRETGAALRW